MLLMSMPPQPSAESNPALVAILRDRIPREGPLTFAQFMETVLYHPEHGYYMAEQPRPGRAGDFLTAPEAHPIFGWTLARQIVELWHLLGAPRPFTLREYGAGSGALGLAVLDELAEIAPDLFAAIRYAPIEANPYRLAEARRRLAEAGLADHIEDASNTTITGCVIANEFLDALPVHRIEQRDGSLQEVYVTWRDGWFADELGPLSTEAIAERLRREHVRLTEGQRAEVCLAIDPWMQEVAAALDRGYVLVLDYGYPAADLYGPERRQGTLKAYYRHGVHEDPYLAIGEQDLTAHVDFTAVTETAEAAGLRAPGLTTQANFLAGAGIRELLVALQQAPGMTAEEYLGARAAVMRMIDPGAMGRFRVLVLGKDVPDASPAGLRFTL